ncbi:MAG: DUF4199 domain-containing protein [Rhizomicrobium sp.]
MSMTRNALIFGSLSGLVVIVGIIVSLALPHRGNSASSEWLGYLIMILALSMIFFGIKRHRDTVLGGVIRFVPALLLGLGIAAMAGVVYVVVWEIYLAATHYTFIDTYTSAVLAAKRAEGLSGAALDAQIAQMQALKAQYANPLYRVPMTFLEIFPVGLVIALVSAALLRNPKVLPARA